MNRALRTLRVGEALLKKYLKKDTEMMSIDDLQWNKEVTEILSKNNYYISKIRLFQEIERTKSSLKALLIENDPKDEVTAEAFKLGEPLLKKYLKKESEMLSIDDLQWNRAVAEILHRGLNYIDKKSLLQEINQKVQYLNEFSEGMRVWDSGDSEKNKQSNLLISKAKTVAKKYSDYTMGDLNETPFPYKYTIYEELYCTCGELAANSKYFRKKTAEDVGKKFLYIIIAFFSGIIGIVITGTYSYNIYFSFGVGIVTFLVVLLVGFLSGF